MRTILLTCLLAAGLSFAPRAPAASDETGEPSRDELVARLQPQPVTRGLRNLVPVVPKVDLTVHFDLDADRVQPRSQPLLERLADALKDPVLSRQRFRIEGHTDASGRPAYNRALSQRRAEAVAAWLTGRGVPADRLETVGLGSDAPVDPDHPRAARNRRVTVITLDQ